MASTKVLLRVVVLIAIFAMVSAVQAQDEQSNIKEIKYEGLFRTRENLIEYKIRSQVGKPVSHDTLVADQKRLIETGYFRDVTVRTEPADDGIIITFSFREKPILQDVLVEGNRTIKTKKILKKVYEKVGRGEIYDELDFYDAIIEIEKLYEKKGYYELAIDNKPEMDTERNEITAVIIIDEGQRGFIKKVLIIGAEGIEHGKIRKAMETKKRKPLAFLLGKGKFEKDVFEEDKLRIQALYQKNGFLDAKVTDDKIEPYGKKGNYIQLVVTIEEGLKYTTGQVTMNGNTSYSTEELEARKLIKEGDVLSMAIVKKEGQRLKDFYSEKGYLDVRVGRKFSPTDKPDILDVVYIIKEGPRISIGKVEIQGNIATKDKVIRRELPLIPGEIYNGLKLKAAISRLRQLGYFSKVDVYPVETSEKNVRDLMIEVEEKNTGQVLFGLGFSSIDNLVASFEVTQKNFDYRNWPHFRGAGQKARLKASFGSERQDYMLSWTEPWLFDRKLSFGFDIFKNKKKYISDDYDQDAYGIRLKLHKELFRRTRGGVIYRWQKVDIDPEDDASEAIQIEEGERTTSSLKFEIINDTRDSYALTTRGWLRKASFEYAGGFLSGETDFTRGEIELAKYVPLPGRIVIKFLAKYGTMEEFGDSDRVPIFERFFLGGRTTVRGYDYRDVGPKDESGEPLGGKSSLLLSSEFTFPLYENMLRGAVFYDAGNVWEDSGEFETDDLKAGWGVGVRVIIPKLNIPVNLDYSWPLDADEFDDDEGRFDFSLGYDF